MEIPAIDSTTYSQLVFIFLNLLPEFPYKSFIFIAILRITQHDTCIYVLMISTNHIQAMLIK